MIERTAFPDPVGALVAGIDADDQSIYERLEELGVVFADAEHVIDSVPASADDARLLGCRPRVPLLRERRRTTNPSGVPLEWSEDRYLAAPSPSPCTTPSRSARCPGCRPRPARPGLSGLIAPG